MHNIAYRNKASKAPGLDSEFLERFTFFNNLHVFISGRINGLKRERDAVCESIKSLYLMPWRSETLGSLAMTPADVCRLMARQCDLYIGIFGGTYGTKLSDGRSVTEMEFDEARDDEPSKILIYLKKTTLIDKAQKEFFKKVQSLDSGYFRRPNFKNPQQLGEWVKKDIIQWVSFRLSFRRRFSASSILSRH